MKSTLCLLTMSLLMLCGCKSTKPGQIVAPPVEIGTGVSAAVPNAVVYRMNGDYADNVPVTLNESRTEIVSWPAPTDINDASAPIKLANGWFLDRRGIAPTSAFLTYTYKEYRRLGDSVTRDELFKHIIPGAEVTEIRTLPIKLWQAVENPVEASRLVENSRTVYQAPEL